MHIFIKKNDALRTLNDDVKKVSHSCDGAHFREDEK